MGFLSFPPRRRTADPSVGRTAAVFLFVIGTLGAAATALASGVPPPSRPTVVVSGATGKVGSRLVRQLLAEKDAAVIALVRDAEKARSLLLDDAEESAAASVDGGGSLSIVEVDYGDAPAVDGAMAAAAACAAAGGSSPLRLFLSCGNVENQAGLELNLARAAERHGAQFCVKLSTASPVLEMGDRYADHTIVEDALIGMRMPHAVLRPNIFMQMFATPGPGLFGLELGDADEDATCTCTHPYADRSVSTIDCEDVAACAAAILCASEEMDIAKSFGGRIFDLTGPEAAKLGDGSNFESVLSSIRPRPVHIKPCTAAERASSMGVPPPVSNKLESFIDVIGSYSKVTNCVEELTGRPPRSVADFVRKNPAPFLPLKYRRLVGTERSPSFRAAAKVVQADTGDALQRLGDDELFIRVQAAGVNGGADTFDCTRASEDARNFPLGHEGAGVVVAAGKRVTRFRPGDRAVFIGNGGYAEYVCANERMCAGGDLSPEASPEQLAALRISGLTALVALESTAGIKAGDTVLVTACCGGTGHFAVQIAKNAGAKVVGTVGSTDKVSLAQNIGVDRVVDLSSENLGDILNAEFPEGIDIVYDGVGGKLLGAAFDNLAEGGRVLVVGSISQYPHNDAATVEDHGVKGLGDVMDIFRAGKTLEFDGGRKIIGNIWGDIFGSEKMTMYRDKVFELHSQGKLLALTDEVQFLGVDAASDAVEHMLSRRSTGKVCLSFP